LVIYRDNYQKIKEEIQIEKEQFEISAEDFLKKEEKKKEFF
jgi:hypothetical protein